MVAKTLSTAEVRSLYEKHGSALVAYLCCLGHDFASAEDAVQQVFLKLLEKKIPVLQTPLAYLYTSVRHTSLNLRRGVRREVPIEPEESWLTAADGSREEALSVQAALRDLPEEQRETVFLKIWGGMTFGEIAVVLEIPANTAASRYRYALEKLREKLQSTAKR